MHLAFEEERTTKLKNCSRSLEMERSSFFFQTKKKPNKNVANTASWTPTYRKRIASAIARTRHSKVLLECNYLQEVHVQEMIFRLLSLEFRNALSID